MAKAGIEVQAEVWIDDGPWGVIRWQMPQVEQGLPDEQVAERVQQWAADLHGIGLDRVSVRDVKKWDLET